jgi:hypothetical protein
MDKLVVECDRAFSGALMKCKPTDFVENLKKEIAAWEEGRNQGNCSVNWRFTTEDARIKLTRLYPSIQN